MYSKNLTFRLKWRDTRSLPEQTVFFFQFLLIHNHELILKCGTEERWLSFFYYCFVFCSDCDEHDGDESDESDEGIDNVDVLRSLMFPPLLNSEVRFLTAVLITV